MLTVRGGSVHNHGDELRLDLAQLESLGTYAVDVDDAEATGRRETFSGPLLRTVLALAGVTGTQTTPMHVTALNDYRIDVPMSDALDLPLLVATRMNGRAMSVADYGPTRFIYPTEGYDLDRATYDPRKVWQLETITVGP